MWQNIPDWEWYLINEQGEVLNTRTNKYLKGDINNIGYHRVTLYDNKRKQRFFIHRLVATLFLPNPNNLPEVNHIDGNKDNNSVSNLEWCNHVHNEHAARRTGLKEYKPFEVTFNDGSVKRYEFAPQLAFELNVTKRTIQNYLQGKSKGYKNKGIEKIQYL